MTDLQDRVRAVLDANRYLVLGTVQPDGSPRVSPVYFTADGADTFFWVSSPLAQHSRNIARDPRVELVVFDSSRPPGETAAVYVTGTAEEVGADELEAACATAFAHVGEGARAFTAEELGGDADLRLYRANASEIALHVRGSDPSYGTGIDTRRVVPPG